MLQKPAGTITIRDFVEDSDLGLEVLVDGDLELPVSWVHVTELLDPSPYVQGGELILSAGIWNAYDGRPDAFVKALANACASGLGWGLLSGDDEVPDAVVEACRSVGLTLIAVPIRTPFIAVGQWFFERLQVQREARLRSTIECGERLIRSISSLPGGLRGILDVLWEEIGVDTWLLGEDGRIIADNAAGPPSLVGIDRQVHGSPTSKDMAVFDVGSGGGAPARLVVDVPPDDFDIEHRSKIEQALPLLDFVLAHERELREAERRLATELVDAVLSKRTQFSAGRLEAYGLDPYGTFVGVVMTPERPRSMLDTTKRTLASLADDIVVAAWQDTVTAIIQPLRETPLRETPLRETPLRETPLRETPLRETPLRETPLRETPLRETPLRETPSPDDLGRSLRNALGPGSAIGIGAGGRGVEGLRRSLIQARQSSNLARNRAAPEGYVVHDKAESHALLLALQDEQVLASFCDSLLGPIEEYDARRNTTLLPTLEAFLASGGQWQATADKLRVHVNTLRHRLSRCEELTGRDLSSMDDRVDFYIATKARNVVHKR